MQRHARHGGTKTAVAASGDWWDRSVDGVQSGNSNHTVVGGVRQPSASVNIQRCLYKAHVLGHTILVLRSLPFHSNMPKRHAAPFLEEELPSPKAMRSSTAPSEEEEEDYAFFNEVCPDCPCDLEAGKQAWPSVGCSQGIELRIPHGLRLIVNPNAHSIVCTSLSTGFHLGLGVELLVLALDIQYPYTMADFARPVVHFVPRKRILLRNR